MRGAGVCARLASLGWIARAMERSLRVASTRVVRRTAKNILGSQGRNILKISLQLHIMYKCDPPISSGDYTIRAP